MSTNHNFWRERRAEADSYWGPSAYQPNTLSLDQTSSHWCDVVLHPYIGPSHMVDSALNTKNQSVWSVLHVKEWCCRVQVYWDEIIDQPKKVNYLHTSSRSSPKRTDWITLHKENAAFCVSWIWTVMTDLPVNVRLVLVTVTDMTNLLSITFTHLLPVFLIDNVLVLIWWCCFLGGGGFNHVLCSDKMFFTLI